MLNYIKELYKQWRPYIQKELIMYSSYILYGAPKSGQIVKE